MFKEAVRIAEKCKKIFPKIPIIYGGIHPTVDPDGIAEKDCFDAWCIGEGEEAFIEFLARIENGSDYTDVENFCFKTENGIIKNKCRPPIAELDSLPFSDLLATDFENTDDYRIFKRFPIMAARGCAFDCEFCCNNAYKKIYGNSYYRFRSPEHICKEIVEVIKKYPNIEYIQFQNDIFFPNIEWLERFEKIYNRDVKLPLSLLMASSQINKKSIKILKKLPIKEVFTGIETNLRLFDIIGKKGKNKIDSIKSLILLKESGINIATFNMMGIPGELGNDIYKSVVLNSIIEPCMIQLSYLYSFPSTKVFEKFRDLISNRKYTNYFQGSVFKKRFLNSHLRFYFINFIAFIEIFINLKKRNNFTLFFLFRLIFKDKIPLSIKRLLLHFFKKLYREKQIFNVRF